jgi:hypothetical protein
MLELDHERVLANAAAAGRMVWLKQDILRHTSGPVVDCGQRRVWD